MPPLPGRARLGLPGPFGEVDVVAVHEEILRAIEQLDRSEQLDLAYWILHKEESGFDLTESVDDLRAIRRGLEDLRAGRTLSGRQVSVRLEKRAHEDPVELH